MKILITGSNGYIAKGITNLFKHKYKIISLCRKDVDLLDTKAVHSWFRDKTFDVVIHTAITGGSRLVVDTQTVLEQNLKMYYNIHNEKDHYGKFISFGSGAEIFSPTTPYGESKLRILDSIQNTDNFYSLRIFGVFDSNELNTRFIKSNIIRYIKKQQILIHADKIMDFYYMNDLCSMVRHYIETKNPDKVSNCSYKGKYTLSYISNFINALDEHKVPVTIENDKNLEFYCGNAHNLPISEIGLFGGIIDTYNQLLKDLNNDSSDINR